MTQKLKFVLKKSRKYCGKRRKCWLPAFSPFPTMFSKVFSSGGVWYKVKPKHWDMPIYSNEIGYHEDADRPD